MPIDSGDTAWLLASTALVMIMTPGVGFFYGGLVRRKNIVSMITLSLIAFALVSVQWVLFGYSLAFGTDINGIIGDLNFVGPQWRRGECSGHCRSYANGASAGIHDIPAGIRDRDTGDRDIGVR